MKIRRRPSAWLVLWCLTGTPVTLAHAGKTSDGEPPRETASSQPYDCLIEPGAMADVGTESRGVISQLLVARGDRVKRGQPIATLESTVEHTAVTLARARAAMHGEVASRTADLSLAEQDFTRFVDPQARELTTDKLRDEAVARKQVAQAALTQAQDTAMLREIELEGAQNELARRTITSPSDGFVVAELAAPGELVFDSPVMRIADLHPLHIELVLESRLFGTIKPGDVGSVVPELGAGLPLEAVVGVVDPMIDPASGTFGVRLHVDNPDYAIPAGQRCQVELAGGRAVQAMPAEDEI